MWSRSAKTNGVESNGTALFLTLLVTYERDTPLHGYGDTMKIGDLVRWENAGGEYELGIVPSLDAYEEYNGVMVYFFLDMAISEMTKDDLEVINESR